MNNKGSFRPPPLMSADTTMGSQFVCAAGGDVMSRLQGKLNDFDSMVHKELCCHSCDFLLSGEVYQCSVGHLVCTICLSRGLKNCRACGEQYNYPHIRNRLAEGLLAFMTENGGMSNYLSS